ncbi:hypothetical protein C5Y96_21105 [Blastopirellula marina]|uniref:Uncharacterized protein n=1 Tax=Blastopirellula marina TaxID=124 RepID=A0A2S8F217_9BACT|nr:MULTISPECIES: hypothetical protein [Pirellulaceae]PQO25954.1 hypothetical protein C5Y96_21105 [Blastopirellula marina]RCS44312.1 hypothetical protein DTL36_21150 [Bremerella cremea]
MEPFEGGPGEPTSEEQDAKLASRASVMEAAAWATSLFVIALVVIGGGGLLMLGVGLLAFATWAVLVFPLLLISGVLLRKMRRNRNAKVAERISKLSVTLMSIGTIGLSILAAIVSFVYCNVAFTKALIHH